jgi:proteasome-associated ATPase
MHLHCGDRVSIAAKTRQIIKPVAFTGAGEIAVAVEDLGNSLLIEGLGGRKTIVKSKSVAVAPGRSVIHDGTAFMMLAPEPPPPMVQSPGVQWDDIGDLELAKRLMRDSIKGSSEIARRFGKKALKGILLYGPPGCGKTMLAKAAATEILKTSTVPGGFIYLKGPEILSKWVGEAEMSVRKLFADARKFKAAAGLPAVIFIDEADAILATRGKGNTMSSTLVPQFLAEWDGLEDSGALIILATNRANDLDEAITREGRIDRKILVDRPGKQASYEIIKLYLSKTICADPQAAAIECIETLFTPTHKNLRGRVCGALLANLVDRAIDKAIHRSTEHEPSAVNASDLIECIGEMGREYSALT